MSLFPACFFDDGHGLLAPLTDLRPACDIRTGALTSFERLRRVLKLDNAVLLSGARGASAGASATGYPSRDQAAPSQSLANPHAGDALFLSARCPLPYAQITALKSGERLLEAQTGHVIAARAPGSAAAALASGAAHALHTAGELPFPALLSRPWHVRTFRDRCLDIDLELLADIPPCTAIAGVAIITGPVSGLRPSGPQPAGYRLAVDPTARIYPGVTFDIEHGSVIIDEGAVIRPGAIVAGPAYIGPGSTVLDRAHVKAHTAIGPQCKVAGEVGGTIFQAFSNKAHDGHLGDSWLGEWVNLGAGTTNSNLLNTYGNVPARAAPGGSNEPTGEQFLGCIIGDHVKTAICTRIMTGAVIHTGAMWAATAPMTGCVPAFTWATDAGTRAYRIERFLEVAHAAMARRKIKPTDVYLARLRELSHLAETRHGPR